MSNQPIRAIFPEPVTVHSDEQLVIDQTITFDENGQPVAVEVHAVEVVPAEPQPHIAGPAAG